MFTPDGKNWDDNPDSIENQNLTKSEPSLKMNSVDLLFLKSEIGATSEKVQQPEIERLKVKRRETRDEVLHVPPKTLSGDLSILRVTLTPPESKIQLQTSPIADVEESKTLSSDAGILEIIDGSEDAPKDRVPWKYLKRPCQYNREKKKFLVSWLRTVHYHYSHVLSRRRMNLTCLNCTLNVKTDIRHVNTIRTRRNACILTVFGLCGIPYMLFLFKDVVHICPFCNVYLGFCPAFRYPQKADVMTDVLTPISLTSIHKLRKRVAITYNETVCKVKDSRRKFSLSV